MFSEKKGKWQKIIWIIIVAIMGISLIFWTLGPIFMY